MPDFNSIRDEYQAWQQANPDKAGVDLGAYSRMADLAQGTNARAIAYNPGVIQQANAAVDRFFRPAGVSLATGVGAPIDRALGTGETAQSVMRGTPRAVAEGLSYFTGGGEISGAAQIASLGAKALGLGDAALHGAAEDPSHPWTGALISAGSLPVGGAAAELGGGVAGRLGGGALSKAAGEVGGISLANEGARQAQSYVDTGKFADPFTKENLVANAVGALPFAPKVLGDFMKGETEENFNAAVAERAKSNSEVQQFADNLPKTAASDTLVEQAAKTDQAKSLAQFLDEKKPGARTFEDSAVGDQALAKVFVDGPPKQVQENFDALITSPTKEAEKFNFAEYIGADEPSKGGETAPVPGAPTEPVSVGKVQFAAFDPAKVESLASVNPEQLTDPTVFARFMHDVNEQLSARWLEETKRVGASDPFFADEDRPGREAPTPQMLNPAVLEQLNNEGRIPKIDAENIKQRYTDALNSGNGDPVGAWQHTVQGIANVMLELGETAKAQKALELQRSSPQIASQKLSEAQRDQAHAENVAKLPVDLQTFLQGQEEADRKISTTKGGRPQWGWGMRRDVVDQAVKNFNPETGKTTVQVAVGNKGERVSRELPLADAVKMPLKQRALPTELAGSAKETSLEAAQEAGRAQGVALQRSSEAEDLDETRQSFGIHERPSLTPGEAPTLELHPADVETPEIGSQSSSKVEPVKNEQALNQVREVYDSLRNPKNEAQTWANFKDAMGNFRSSRDEIRARQLFGLAVEAKMSGAGSDAAAEFARKYWGKDIVTPKEVSQAIGERGFWREGKWEAVQDKIGELSGLKPGEVQAMAGGNFDFRSGMIQTDSTPKTLAQSIPEALQTHFRMQNYGPIMVGRMTTLGTKLVAAFGELGNKVDFAQLATLDPLTRERMIGKVTEELPVLGLHTMNYTDAAGQIRPNPLIALALGHSSKGEGLQPVHNFLTVSTIAHELVHEVQRTAQADLQSPDFDVRTRAQAYTDLQHFSASLNKTDKYAVLRNIFDVVVPPALTRDTTGRMRAEFAGFLNHGTSSDAEFIAQYAQYYAAGLCSEGTKLTDVRTALAWEPSAVQDFIRGIYRNVADFTNGFVKMALDPRGTAQALKGWFVEQNPAKTAAAVGNINERMRDLIRPDARVIGSNQAMTDTTATLSSGNLHRMLQEPPVNYSPPRNEADVQFMANLGVNEEEAKGRVTEALMSARDHLFGNKVSQGIWQGFSPYAQAAAAVGTDVAKDATNILLGHGGRIRGLADSMLGPVMTRDAHGRLMFDTENPAIKLVQGKLGDGPTKAFNDAMRIFQEHTDKGNLKFDAKTSQTPFSSSVASNPAFAKEIMPLLQKLSPPNRTIVLGAGDKVAQVYQNAGEVRLQAGYENNAAKVARVLQTIIPEAPYDQAYQRGLGIVQGLRDNNAKALQTALEGLDPAKSAELVKLAGVINAPLSDFQKQLAARPGFMSEARQGRFIVESVGKDGKRQTDGARDEASAKELAAQLKREGNTGINFYDKYQKFGEFAGDMPADYAQKFSQLETASFQQSLEAIKQKFGQPVADALAKDFNPAKAVEKSIASTTSAKYDMQRKLAGGRERLDYLDNMNSYVEGLSRNLANRKTRDMTGLLLADKRMDAVPDFKDRTALMLGNVMNPTPEWLGKTKTVMTGLQLGGQLAGAVVNPVQDISIVHAQLVHSGDSVLKAAGRLTKGLSQVGQSFLNPSGQVRLAREASQLPDISKGTIDQQKAFYLQKFQDEEPRVNQYDDLDLNRSKGFVDRARQGLGDTPLKNAGSLFGNGLYQLSAKMVKAYSWSTNLSTKAAFLAGFEQAHEQGLRGQQAYDAARRLVYTTTGGGGKANQVGLVAAANQAGPLLRTGVGLMNVLQTFGLNLTSMYGRFASDAIGREAGQTVLQRRQAQKAFGVLLTTQTALAGALGLPFAAASLAACEKLFGIQANAAVRQGLASLGGDDKELGAAISDTALNGIANQLFGVDVAGKTGMSSVLGTNGYDGFNFQDLLGPAPGMLGNVVDALTAVRQGNPGRAVSEIIPQGFRNAAQMVDTSVRYGRPQMMDKQQNLIMTPTALQSVLYAVGFRPKELAQYQQAQQLLTTSDKLGAQTQERDVERLARGLLGGDTQSVRNYIDQVRQQNPMVNPTSILDSVMEKAMDMEQQKDLLTGGTRQTAEQREDIAATYPAGAVPRQSETQRLVQKQNMLMSMGMPYGAQPAGAGEYMQAAIVDELTKLGMARTDAVRQAQLMMGAAPYRTI
jgi:hypothetical protein